MTGIVPDAGGVSIPERWTHLSVGGVELIGDPDGRTQLHEL
jgi:hypothetical protein